MPTNPPYDRSVALACTMRTLRARWLHVRCRCGHGTPHPVRLMLQQRPACAAQTLADILVSLRCDGCGGRGRLTVHLCATAHGPATLPPAIDRGWSLLLHDAATADFC